MTQPSDTISTLALLGEPTRRGLYEFVVQRGTPVSRDEAAAGLGISRELAAFHLERLIRAGLLEAEFRRLGARRGPGAGRPAKVYRRAQRDLAVSLPPRHYEQAAEVLAEAVNRLDRESAMDAVADVARARGAEAAASARTRKGRSLTRRRVDRALLDLLQDGGYEPQVEAGSNTVRLRNCPYHELASRHRDLTCGMNLAWAEGIVDGLDDPELRATRTPTHGSCCVAFERVSD
ncbi:MAG TPA: helix-turn-helix domain-containing protein [Candidatus Limnocylindria bacterium]|nr:helix-turn-helix domain-containing protein [Candidatus Limnocylindria bacterium]